MRLKKIGFILFMFILSAALIGCGADKDKLKEEMGGADTNQEGIQGGELNVGFNVQPPTLDSHFSTDNGTRDISQHIFEGLITLNTSLEVEPMLAETYEVSDGGKIITFHLRENILFHNGEEMTADDVVASMERWLGMATQAITYLDGTKFEAVDPYTVVAHIEDPKTVDLYVLADMTQFAAIMPKDIVENAGSNQVTEYIGTGPYQLEEWKQDQYIHLTRFDDYQSRTEASDGFSGEKKALADDIYFHIVADSSTRVAGVLSGEYDIVTSIPTDSAISIMNNKNVKNSIHSSAFVGTVFNKKSGFFSNQKARQAANAAINVEDMLVAAYVNEDFYVKDHALVKPEQTGWYTDEGSDVFNTYDPDIAKQLLDEAGYNGEEIVILTTREYPDIYNMTIVIQQQLEAVGMNVKLEVSDWGTVIERRKDPNNFDIFLTNFTMRSIPTMHYFLNPEWIGWTDSEEMKQISDKIIYAESVEEAQKLSGEYHRAFWEYLPVIKPGNSTVVTSMGKDVEGYQHISGPILWNVSVNK